MGFSSTELEDAFLCSECFVHLEIYSAVYIISLSFTPHFRNPSKCSKYEMCKNLNMFTLYNPW